jgi:hypothetical protein
LSNKLTLSKIVLAISGLGLVAVFAILATQLANFSTPVVSEPITRVGNEALLGITPQPDDLLCPHHPLLEEKSTFEEFIAQAPTASGFGYAVNYDEIPQLTTIGVNTYRVEANTAFTITLSVYYGAGASDPQEVNIRYILLINGQQHPIRDENPYEYITLSSGQPIALPITIPPLETGTHDIILIGLIDWPLRATGDSQALIYRSSLIVGEGHMPSQQVYHRLIPVVTNASGFSLGLHTQESQHNWVHPEVYRKVEGALEFFISAGYIEDEGRLRQFGITPQPMTTAFVGFIDGRQIPLSAEGDPFYAEIAPNTTYGFIPVSIDSSPYTGQQELTILRINHPQIPQCWLYGTGYGYWFNFSVYSSRVGVDFGG